MDLSVIIVSWNVREKLKVNLLALFKSTGLSLEVLVIDNNSADDSVAMIKQNFPQVKLIINQTNLGFAKACNQGIKESSGRYVLLLNPDMLVSSDTLVKTINWADANPQAAITGIKLINEEDLIVGETRRLPKIWDQFLVASKLGHILPWLLNNYLNKNFDYTKASRVESIRGSYFLIRRETINKIGLLDERYFIWFEETDYCAMVRNHGLQVWYTPAATATDYIAQSFKQVDLKVRQNYFKTSMLAYFKKWYPGWRVSLLKFGWGIGDLIVKLVS
jgi:hypothetical protein